MSRVTAPWQIKRETKLKVEGKTNPKYGCTPEQRPIKDYIRFGVINLDKPPGPSSHEVAAWVKKILNLNLAGHGGTLEAQDCSSGLRKSQSNRRVTHSS